MVEPRIAAPERVGSEVSVGGWLVTALETDHTDADSRLLALVVCTVMNLPASEELWVYELLVAPGISEHWLGVVDIAEST